MQQFQEYYLNNRKTHQSSKKYITQSNQKENLSIDLDQNLQKSLLSQNSQDQNFQGQQTQRKVNRTVDKQPRRSRKISLDQYHRITFGDVKQQPLIQEIKNYPNKKITQNKCETPQKFQNQSIQQIQNQQLMYNTQKKNDYYIDLKNQKFYGKDLVERLYIKIVKLCIENQRQYQISHKLDQKVQELEKDNFIKDKRLEELLNFNHRIIEQKQLEQKLMLLSSENDRLLNQFQESQNQLKLLRDQLNTEKQIDKGQNNYEQQIQSCQTFFLDENGQQISQKQFQQQLSSYKQEINKLKVQLNQYQLNDQQQKNQIKNLSGQLSNSKNQNKEISVNETNFFENSYEQIENIQKEEEQQNQNSLQEIKIQYENKMTELQQQNKKLLQSIEKLQADEKEQKKEFWDKQLDRIADLRSELFKQTREKDSLRIMLSQYKKENQEIQEQVEQLNKKLLEESLKTKNIEQMYQQKKMEIVSEYNIIDKNLKIMTEDYKNLQLEYNDTIVKYEEKIKNLTQKNQNTNESLGKIKFNYELDSQNQIVIFQKEKKLMQSKLDQYQQQVQELKKQIMNMQEIVSQSKQNQDKVQFNQEEAYSMQKKLLKQIEQFKEESFNNKLKLEEQLDVNLKQQKKIQDLQLQLKQMENYYRQILDKKDEYNKNTENKFYEYKNNNQNELFKIKNQLSQAQTQIKNYEVKYQSQEDQMKQKEQEIKNKNILIDNIRNQIVQLEQQKLTLQNNLETLSENFQNKEIHLQSQIKELEKVYTKNSQNSSYKIKRFNQDANMKLEEQQDHIEQLKKQLIIAEEDLKKYKGQIQNIRYEYEQDIQNLKNLLNQAKQETLQTKKINDGLSSEFQQLRSMYETKIFDIEINHQKQIQNYQENNELLKKELKDTNADQVQTLHSNKYQDKVLCDLKQEFKQREEELKGQNERQSQKIKQMFVENQRLEKQIEILNVSVVQYQQKLGELQNIIQQNQQQLIKLKRKLSNQNQTSVESQYQEQDYTQQNQELIQQIELQQQQIEQLNIERNNLFKIIFHTKLYIELQKEKNTLDITQSIKTITDKEAQNIFYDSGINNQFQKLKGQLYIF